MKNTIVLISIVAAMLLVSCHKNKDSILDATPKTLSFAAADAASQTIIVTAENVGWDVEVPADIDWIFTERNGNKVTVTVDNNSLADPRNGNLTIASQKSGVADVRIVVSQRGNNETVFRSGSLEYLGKVGDAGTFLLTLDSTQLDNSGNITGNGETIYLHLFSELPAGEIMNLATGIYTVNRTGGKFTAMPGERSSGGYEYSYVVAYEDGTVAGEIGISGGMFVITQQSGGYAMEFDLELSDDTMLYGQYSGTLDMVN